MIKIDFSINKQVEGIVICSVYIMSRSRVACKKHWTVFHFSFKKVPFCIFNWMSLRAGAVEMGRSSLAQSA